MERLFAQVTHERDPGIRRSAGTAASVWPGRGEGRDGEAPRREGVGEERGEGRRPEPEADQGLAFAKS